MFLRVGCTLPDGLGLIEVPFGKTWMSVEDTMSGVLDVKVRDAGWHFLWLEDAYSRFGMGRTAKAAIHKAMTRALSQVKGRFNAAELHSVNLTKYLGFEIAKVTLHACHIQQETSLSQVDAVTIRQLRVQ